MKKAKYNLGTDWRGYGYGGTAKRSNNNVFLDYGEGYRKGDIIGCCCDLETGNIVYFKNGRCMGVAFTVPTSLNGRKLYPTVAVRNMKFKLNFGRNGFCYTPEQFKKVQKVQKVEKPRTKLLPNHAPHGSYSLDIIINKGDIKMVPKVPPKFIAVKEEVQQV